MTYATLERRVWSEHTDSNPIRARILVRTLRGKLGNDTANPACILDEHGAGFRMPEAGVL